MQPRIFASDSSSESATIAFHVLAVARFIRPPVRNPPADGQPNTMLRLRQASGKHLRIESNVHPRTLTTWPPRRASARRTLAARCRAAIVVRQPSFGLLTDARERSPFDIRATRS